MSWDEIKALVAELAIQSKETDRKFRETERMLKELGRSPRHRVRVAGREQEYDVLAWANGKVNQAVVVEVKSRVKREAIDQLIVQIEELPKLVPELAGKERLGILAGVDWDAGVMEAAQAAGLYTACIHDELFTLTTPQGFRPRLWGGRL